MKKIITFVLSAMAISMSLSAQETSLRDQLVGVYDGDAMGGDYSTPPDYGWQDLEILYGYDGQKLVNIAAGENDDQVVITNLFPEMEGYVETGVVGTVTATSDYSGWLGYISLASQVVGTFNGKEVTLKNMYYSDNQWNLTTDPIEVWIKEDGSLSMGVYATLRYPGDEYEMYLCYLYADLTPANYTDDDAELANLLRNYYKGTGSGGDYSTPPDYAWQSLTMDYGGEDSLVEIMLNGKPNKVAFYNFFPEIEGFEDNGMVGTVHSNSDYDGWLGYITIDSQVVGKYNDKEVTLYNMYYSDNKWYVTTDPIEIWVKADGSLSMGVYATLCYPGDEYDMYLCYVYADLAPIDYTFDDVELASKLVGDYEGTATGGDYSTPPNYGWTALSFNYNEGDYDAVEISMTGSDNEVLIENIFPEIEGFEDEGLIGKVHANSDYAGWLGYISIESQVVGTFNGKDVTLKNMYYSDNQWYVTTDPIELWVTEDGALSSGVYATLLYPGEEYDMYLVYVNAALTPVEGGVQGIAADVTATNNAPVELFTINGMRVNSRNLAPGLYIRRQGNEVTKVIIK